MYTPFDIDISELNEAELNKLIDNKISEGWYIEYKSDFPKSNGKIDSAKLVKTISAFANTKGGWVFFGVLTANNLPTELYGLNLSIYHNIEDQLSQIISSNISPKPIYHFKLVHLENGNVVVVVKIEDSPTPPYITSNGTIFQREHNESKPVIERYIIERMAEKTNGYYDLIEQFSRINYTETKGQSDSNQTYLEIYFFPLPFNQHKFKHFKSSDFFKKTAAIFFDGVDCNFNIDGQEAKIHLGFGFNSIYSSQDSLIIRPLTGKNLIYKTTTAELYSNGNIKFTMPIQEYNLSDIPDKYNNSHVIDYLLNSCYDYYGLEQTDFHKHAKIIDGAQLIYSIIIFTETYNKILEENNLTIHECGFRIKITNAWRKFLFFDTDDYLEKVKLYNIPITPKDEIEIPTFTKGCFYTINPKSSAVFIELANHIMEAIGLPDISSIRFDQIIKKEIERMQNSSN